MWSVAWKPDDYYEKLAHRVISNVLAVSPQWPKYELVRPLIADHQSPQLTASNHLHTFATLPDRESTRISDSGSGENVKCGIWGPGCKSSVQLSLSRVSSPCDNIDGEPRDREIGTRYRGVNEELIIGAVFGRYITGTLDTGIPHPSQYITYSQDTR